MATQVIISSATNVTPPFSGIACDVYGNNCSYLGVGYSFPIVFTLPAQFNTAPALQLTLFDSVGCSLTEILNCIIDPSLPKQFQDLEYFFFMDGDIYQFQ
jgi:hypothetical protein